MKTLLRPRQGNQRTAFMTEFDLLEDSNSTLPLFKAFHVFFFHVSNVRRICESERILEIL